MMTQFRRLGLLCFAIVCNSVALAQAEPATRPTTSTTQPVRLTAAQLQADVALLRRAFEELHPGLYRYNSREQMDRHFADLREQLSRDQTLAEAFLALSQFTAKIKCGHTFPNPANQGRRVVSTIFAEQRVVPFTFRWIDGRMIVSKNLSADPRLSPGMEIVSINGITSRQILDRLMTIARADGANDAKRISLCEVTGASEYEPFDIYFPLFFPPANPAQFDLVVRRGPDAESMSLAVPSMTRAERNAKLATTRLAESWSVTIDARDRVAILAMPDWAMYNSKWDWQRFLDNCADRIAREKPRALVIDLRGNEGGNDCGNVILSWLIDHDLRLEGFRRLVRYRQTPAELNPHLDTWDNSFRDWAEFAQGEADANGFYRLTKFDDEPGADMIKPAPADRRFRGEVFVIVDATNSSATFQFASIVQQHKLARLVGQPTGGNQRGINGGAFFFLRLPNSRIEIDLPLVGFFPDDYESKPDAGLTPDVLVERTADDLSNRTDAEMTAIRALRGR